MRPDLSYYLKLDYTFNVIADQEDGGYVIRFPDLPGCLTQVDSIDEVSHAAAEIKNLWIRTEYDRNRDIPLPSIPESHSGKFNVRLPKSLHRRLVELAAMEGVSLNQLVMSLLSEASAVREVNSLVRNVAASQAELTAAFNSFTAYEAVRVHVADYAIDNESDFFAQAADDEVIDERPSLLPAAA